MKKPHLSEIRAIGGQGFQIRVNTRFSQRRTPTTAHGQREVSSFLFFLFFISKLSASGDGRRDGEGALGELQT